MASSQPPQKPPEKRGSLLSTSASGASLLIALQVGSRALTFIANQLLLRYLSPELLGISTQLEVYSISVLFFSRESLRVALQRQADPVQGEKDGKLEKKNDEKVPGGHVDGSTAAGRTQGIVNLAYIAIYLGAFFALVLALLYTSTLRSGDISVLETPYFGLSLQIYGIAAFWELLAEPSFVVVQQKGRVGIRARAEGIATVLRCITTCGFAVVAKRKGWEVGVLPFAAGQMGYAVILVLVYLWNVWDISSIGGFFLVPTAIYSKEKGAYLLGYFPWSLLSLGGSLFAQSIIKHILTQGDTLLISWLATPRSQGIYALANNYGGLIARLLLQPIEESSRNHFGKLLSSSSSPPSKPLIQKARSDLNSLLRAYLMLSICVLAVGPTVAPLLLNLVAGKRWASSGAGHVLGIYCYYIPLLALNGISEAFVSSVATEAEVNKQSAWMLAFSAGFGSAAYFFLRVLDMGAEGLVWANSLNMLLRIVWSGLFIKQYLRRWQVGIGGGGLLPRATTVGVAVGAWAGLRGLEKTFTGGFSDLLKSGAVAGIFVLVV
ncbi:Rft protein-domain-containing protein [Bisporella sp. PMI_857]|nr:Rft protein-domain-containing protein [Bisporella sp. PMI_857]